MPDRHPLPAYQNQLDQWLFNAEAELDKAQKFLETSETPSVSTQYLIAQATRLIQQAKGEVPLF